MKLLPRRATARADPAMVTADTLPGLLAERTRQSAAQVAFQVEHRPGIWVPVAWSQFDMHVRTLASRFAAAGLGPGDRLGILAPTSYGWELAQFAAMHVGATVVGIDPYYPDAEIVRIVAQTRVVALALARADMMSDSLRQAAERLRFVVLTEEDDADAWPSVHAWSAASVAAGETPPAASPDAPALVTFSSGTTGKPSPVVYTHRQVLLACRTIVELYPEVRPGAHLLSWLPLANLFQRMINFCGIMRGFTSFLLADPRRVMEALPVARPEALIAVPRFCERVREGVLARVAGSRRRQRAWAYAFALAQARARAHATGRPWGALRRTASRIADRAVLRRVRAVFGGRLKFIVTGSAPMPQDLLEWFDAIGIPVLEAYGTSESVVPIAACRWLDRRAGTVGRPIAANELRLTEEGEILVRGEGVFLPGLGENRGRAGAIDREGYLHTGDIGILDAQGYLRLLGRKQDVFKGTDGRWVIPSEIESALGRLPGVEHAAVFRRDGAKLVAVLALGDDARADAPGRPIGDPDATKDSALDPAIAAALAQVLEELPRSARPQACLFVRSGFSIAGGELTTNLKLRRPHIAGKYQAQLETLLASGGSDVRHAVVGTV